MNSDFPMLSRMLRVKLAGVAVVAIALLAAFGWTSTVHAQTMPKTISIQGVIDESASIDPNGTQPMVFSLYDAATGGSALWTETQSVQLFQLHFNVILGETTPITLPFNTQYWLGVKVADGAEMQPRIQLTGSPYAFRSLNADLAANATHAMRADSAGGAARAAVAMDLAPGASVVRSLNGATGALEIVGSGNTNVARSGNQITISSSDSTGVQGVIASDNTIVVEDLAGPVVKLRVRPGTINTNYITDDAIITPKILDGAVTSEKISDRAIEAIDIAPGAIDNVVMGDDAITTSKIRDGAVTDAKVNDVAWTKITGAPTSLAPSGPAGGALSGTYPNPDLADGAVTDAKVASGISYSKLTGVPTSLPPNGAAGGDLGASYPNPTVVGLQGRAVANMVPTADQVLRWNATTTQWEPAADLSLPLSRSISSTSTLLDLTNTGTGGAGGFHVNNASSTTTALGVSSNGIGSGISVQLTNASNGGRGLDVLQSGVGPGVFSTSTGGNGVWGITNSISAAGVIGDNTFGEAVVGRNRGGVGVGAVVGRNDSSGYGVRGFNTKNGIGVLGQSGISGGTGVAGRFENVNAGNFTNTVEVSTNGIGSGINVQLTNSSNGARGVDVAQSGVGPGVFSTSTGGNGVWGITSSISAAGVIGDNTFGEAVVGRNRGGVGVGAVVGRNDSSGYGVRGFNTKNGYGVLGQAGISGGTGVAGRFENVNAANTSDALQVSTNSSGNAARFTGNVVISGNLTVSGTVAKGGGSFKIDHPLDPENKYLYHSFVESPDMMNIYNGNVTLDHSGAAVVTMPDWFQALNMEFRYQLTPIGAPGPNLYIAQEIEGNQFRIAGGSAGAKVSWQVTGIRHDPYANAHRIPVEQAKPADERGHLLFDPNATGQTVESNSDASDVPTASSKAASASTQSDRSVPTRNGEAPAVALPSGSAVK